MTFNETVIQDYFNLLKNHANFLEESGIDITKLKSIFEQDASIQLTEENLLKTCNELLVHKNVLGDRSIEVSKIRAEIIQYLRSFVASGIDVEVDPNAALVLDTQNPDFTVTFKNNDGKTKRRKYALEILSAGFKIEFSIKVEVITIIGKNFNYYDTNKTLVLGPGIDFGTGWLSATVCKIEELGCGLLLFGLAFGILGSVSYVYKGTMTPTRE